MFNEIGLKYSTTRSPFFHGGGSILRLLPVIACPENVSLLLVLTVGQKQEVRMSIASKHISQIFVDILIGFKERLPFLSPAGTARFQLPGLSE